jgi:uncharacterized membrane protein YphA (DoxX/SURF4 family)
MTSGRSRLLERQPFATIDTRLAGWMARHGLALLRYSLGLVFLWFGALKFVPGLSPAQDLAVRTITELTGSALPGRASLTILAVWECLIGLGLLTGVALRTTLLLLWLQMLGAIMPVFLFADVVFMHPPYAPTLEGQYVIKNLVLVSAGLVLGATVRGGGLVTGEAREPGVERP